MLLAVGLFRQMLERKVLRYPTPVNRLVTVNAEEEAIEAQRRGERLQVFLTARWRELGGKRGISGIAATAGVHRDTLYHWFSGEGEPSLTALRSLADAVKVRRAEIVAAIDGQLPPPDFRSDLQAAMADFLRSGVAAGVLEVLPNPSPSRPSSPSRAAERNSA